MKIKAHLFSLSISDCNSTFLIYFRSITKVESTRLYDPANKHEKEARRRSRLFNRKALTSARASPCLPILASCRREWESRSRVEMACSVKMFKLNETRKRFYTYMTNDEMGFSKIRERNSNSADAHCVAALFVRRA